jgi:hypothetical protein
MDYSGQHRFTVYKLSVRGEIAARQSKKLVFREYHSAKSNHRFPCPLVQALPTLISGGVRSRQEHERLLAGSAWHEKESVFTCRGARRFHSRCTPTRTSCRAVQGEAASKMDEIATSKAKVRANQIATC